MSTYRSAALIAACLLAGACAQTPETGATAEAAPMRTAQAGQPAAEGGEAGPDAAGTVQGDPNRIVCRSAGTTGTRLGKAQTCMTAGEWAQQKAQNRQAIERGQTQRWYGN